MTVVTPLVAAEHKLQGTAEDVRAIGSRLNVGLSGFASLMLGVGSMIGSMAWLIHGAMLAKAGPLASLTAWVLGALSSLPLALIVAELASMFPSAGGPYVYKYYAFKRLAPKSGELFGFLTGWLFWICLMTGLSCMSNGFANLLSTAFFGSATNGPLWFGPLVIIALWVTTTVLNLMPITNAARVSNCFTIMKFAMAAVFAALVFSAPGTDIANLLNVTNCAGEGSFWTNVTNVLMLAIAGFGGVELAACASSETSNPQKTVPRNVVLTLLLTASIYISMSVAISMSSPFVLSPDETTAIIQGTSVKATCPSIAGYVGGKIAGAAMTFAVVASIIGCGFACLLNAARIGYSMSETGLFPRSFATLAPGTKVPAAMLWFQMWFLCVLGVGSNLLARTGVFADAYSFLGEVFGFLYSFLAVLYGVSLVSLRYTDPNMERPFRAGKKGNTVAWVLSIVSGGVYTFAAFGCTTLSHQIAALVLLLAGIPVYIINKRQRKEAGRTAVLPSL